LVVPQRIKKNRYQKGITGRILKKILIWNSVTKDIGRIKERRRVSKNVLSQISDKVQNGGS